MISVIIPVYNVEKYLDRCLKSIIDQSIKFNEVILINDGSTDNSGDICKKYVNRYDYLKYIEKSNQGLSDTRNLGIEFASNEWIMFLDSDDEISLNSNELFIELILKLEKDIFIIAGEHSRVINNNIVSKKISSKKNIVLSGEKYLMNELSSRTYSPVSVRNLYRKEYLLTNKILFKSNLLHEDELFTIQCLINCKKVFISNINFYFHHIREGSITTSNVKVKNAISVSKICEDIDSLMVNVNSMKLVNEISNHFINLSFLSLYNALRTHDYDESYFNKRFVKTHKKNIKNSIRFLLLKINPRLFYSFEKLVKNVKTKIV